MLAAPLRHQRMQRVPVLDAIRFGREARIATPGRRSHGREPCSPLLVLAWGDRGVAVVRGQYRDGCAVAVGEALALPALAALTRTRELGHSQCRQRFLKRDIDA